MKTYVWNSQHSFVILSLFLWDIFVRSRILCFSSVYFIRANWLKGTYYHCLCWCNIIPFPNIIYYIYNILFSRAHKQRCVTILSKRISRRAPTRLHRFTHPLCRLYRSVVCLFIVLESFLLLLTVCGRCCCFYCWSEFWFYMF